MVIVEATAAKESKQMSQSSDAVSEEDSEMETETETDGGSSQIASNRTSRG